MKSVSSVFTNVELPGTARLQLHAEAFTVTSTGNAIPRQIEFAVKFRF